jgi:hypothetical protein
MNGSTSSGNSPYRLIPESSFTWTVAGRPAALASRERASASC